MHAFARTECEFHFISCYKGVILVLFAITYMKHRRLNGVVLPLFSLRRENDHGIGDLRALRHWIDWAAEAKVGFLQLLPVNALANDDAPSPYSAISSVALEPLYIALEPWAVPGMVEEVACETLESHPWYEPSGDNLTDYPKVRAWKNWVLRRVWKQFQQDTHTLNSRADFAKWRAEQGAWLEDFVCFKVLSDFFGTNAWWNWPEQDKDRARELACQFPDALDFQAWLQWVCALQWGFVRAYADERGVALMGDIPIGVSMASADVFFERHYFDTSWCGGAPAEGNYGADPFTAKWGQNWGIPLYKWDVLEDDDFAWWRRRVQHTARIFSMYRIDHILGFYRIYAFPWMPEHNGEFLPLSHEQAANHTGGRLPQFMPRNDDTAENRTKNLADGDYYLSKLLSAAPEVEVVGEDLGCVPDYVRPDMRNLNIPGFKIPHWEVDSTGQIELGATYHECSFATYGTHDFDTIICTWNECYEKVHHAKMLGLWDETAGVTLPIQDPAMQFVCQQAQDAAHLLRWFAHYAKMPAVMWQAPWNDEIKTSMFLSLLKSNSRYTALLWTELFDVDCRLNYPGTVGGTNWRLRMPFTAQEATQMPQTAWLATITTESDRLPPKGEEIFKALARAKGVVAQEFFPSTPPRKTWRYVHTQVREQ